jgi:hypothetical protein
LANAYMNAIQRLGVDFSKAKTHISPYFCEFAKQLIYKGENISPFPVSALAEVSKRYFNLIALLIEQNLRGFTFSLGLSEAVVSFYGIVKSKPRKFREALRTKSYITERIMKVIRGILPADEAMNDIVRQLNYPLPTLSLYSSRSILVNNAVEAFSESDPTTSKKGGDLGSLAIHVVEILTTKDYPPILFENPLLHAYGSVEQKFLDLRALARKLDTELKGE